ncbi:MAG: topoisomerase subunit [Rhodospirillaceae bacterium]|jgi:topoisomerase-4 subunit A|nr:topoisomerase subunit [Rhodospirillaceae bacterium]
MAKTTTPAPRPPGDEIRLTPLADALSERYLSYALSTIMSRSLPDVRDGLKPVHRRLLFAMRQLHLDPGSGFKKSARVVGDVMGKFHPHGDAAIYDAMVRLAQDFAVRYPLVDGQGNFGNIDGDNAAAMRYTEARLTEAATALLDGIDEDAIDFRRTYDGEDREPIVLPGGLPNLLANGSQGIAVGMATSVPPHNLAEVCDALIHLIKFPKATLAKLVDLMPGPDFPTGGVLVESRESLVESYRTGRGSLRLRAKWRVEKLKGGTWQVVVEEIPFQVPKSRLIERIAQLLQDRKLAFLADVHDESTADVRIVLEPRSRTVDPAVLMESLFRQTDLETRFPLNMNLLDAEQTPRVMSLPEVLQAYLDHRRVVLQRRTRFRLANIEHRLEVLGGYLIAYLNIDEVIRIVREEDEPRKVMIRRLKVTEVQADAILNMRLKSLRKLEEMEIRQENEALNKEQKDLGQLLKSDERQWQRISEELADIRKRFGPSTPLGRRRTHAGEPPADIEMPVDAMIEREPVTVVCSDKGWIRAQKGHVTDASELKYKEGDRGRFLLHAETTDKLIVFGTNGRFYTLGIDKLPGGRGHGEPIRLMIDLGNDQDIVAVFVHKPGRKLLVVSSDGRGFIVPEDQVVAQTRGGKQVLNLADGGEAAACTPVEGDTVAVIGENRKLLLFPLAELPEMTRGRGVILQRYKDGSLSDVKCFTYKEGLSWKQGDRQRTESNLADWRGERGQSGRLPPQGFTRSNKFG